MDENNLDTKNCGSKITRSINRRNGNAAAFTSLLENESLSDVSFSIDGQLIPAHRFILASRSNVFYNPFFGVKTSTAPDSHRFITIDDISIGTFKALLSGIYTNRLQISQQNIAELLYAANKYEVNCLSQICIDHIETNMNESNVLHIFDFLYTKKVSFPLQMKLLRYICNNFYVKFNDRLCLTAITNENALKHLIEQLVEIDHLSDNGRFEYDLFEMLIEWAKMTCEQNLVPIDIGHMRMYLKDILPLIRITNMNLDMMQKYVQIYPGFFTKQIIGEMLQLCDSTSMGLGHMELDSDESDCEEDEKRYEAFRYSISNS